MMDETLILDHIVPPPSSVTRPDDVLQVDDLTVSIRDALLPDAGGKTLIDHVSFSVRIGEIFAITGESGNGKTTLARALARLLPASEYHIDGRARFLGHDLLSVDGAERRLLLRTKIRYLFQEPGQALNPIARIGTQMRFAFDQQEAYRERFHRLLSVFGLDDHRTLERSYPHELSIGTLQRILLALALAPAPALLVADEPTSAIDFILKHAMMEQLQHLCRQEHLSIVFITHDLPLVERYADRAVHLAHGRLDATA